MPLLHIRPLFASFLCPLLFAFLLPVAAAAQEDSADSVRRSDPANSSAVQFHLLGGSGASFILTLSERTALRFQAGADLTAESSDGTETSSARDGDSVLYINERDLGTAETRGLAPGNPVSETESDRSGWWYDITLARLGMAIHF